MTGWSWLGQVLAMVGKEIKQLWRDRPLFIFIVYIFTLNVMMAGSDAGRSTSIEARLVVYDGDRSAASRDLIYRFREPQFRFLGLVASPQEGQLALERGEAVIFIEIPHGFQRDLLLQTKPGSMQELVDTAKSTTAYLASAYSGAIIGRFAQEWAAKAQHQVPDPRIPVVQNQTRIWYNQRADEAWFSTIAELLQMLTVCCMLLPASAMMREKERGTIEQLLVCPLSPFQILLSKALAMALVMELGTAFSVYWILQGMFGVPMRGSALLFFSLTAVFTFTSAGIGFLIASYSKTSPQAGMLTLLVAMPMIMLSGTWTPVDTMPKFLQWALNLSPMKHFIEISYAIMIRGASFDNIRTSATWMIVMGFVLFGIGLWRFRRQFA